MTPSRRRKNGRECFDPDLNPENHNPYSKDSLYYEDWMEGWYEAAEIYNKEQREKKEENMELEACPWNNGWTCLATGKDCSRENCAVIYLKDFMQ